MWVLYRCSARTRSHGLISRPWQLQFLLGSIWVVTYVPLLFGSLLFQGTIAHRPGLCGMIVMLRIPRCLLRRSVRFNVSCSLRDVLHLVFVNIVQKIARGPPQRWGPRAMLTLAFAEKAEHATQILLLSVCNIQKSPSRSAFRHKLDFQNYGFGT